MSGANIVDAKIFTTTDGIALDVFSVQDADGRPLGDARRIERLRQTIARVLGGEIVPRTVIDAQPGAPARRGVPRRAARDLRQQASTPPP